MSDARIDYNLKQAGVTWKKEQLPPPFSTLDPATAAFADAVATFQSAKGLTADGKLGPGTFAKMVPPAPAKPIEGAAGALVESCHVELRKGVKEVGGANCGPDVEKYQKSVGVAKGGPWCAAFVAWNIMNSRGLQKPPSWCSGSVATQWHQASKRVGPEGRTTPQEPGFQKKVQPGWIWCRAKDPVGAKECRSGTWVQGHTGVVVKVDEKGWTTIEGNTNAAGSRDGDGVYLKTHLWTNAAQVDRTIGWFDASKI